MGQCASRNSPIKKAKSVCAPMNRDDMVVRSPKLESKRPIVARLSIGENGSAFEDHSVKYERPPAGFVRRLSRRFSKDSSAFARRGSASTQKQAGSSTTFSIDEGCFEANPLNINEATVEELMTLPEVNRQVAESILSHRKSIGGFRRPEDIALVSGVGAARFHLIKDEICVSINGFKRFSYDRASIKSFKHLNINKATIFELMTVPGITQEMAAAIVSFREKKGPFRSLQDLQKVRGINLRYALSLRPYLTVDDIESEYKSGSTNGSFVGHDASSASCYTRSEESSPTDEGLNFTAHRRQIQALASALNEVDSPRLVPLGIPIGAKCFRIGSWNLEDLSCDKVNNPGVREVVCRTILKNSFSLVLLQGVLEEAAVKQLCDYLNISKRHRNNAVWDYLCNSSGLAIVYLNGHAILEDIVSTNGNLASLRSLQLVKFKVFDSNIALLNCYVDEDEIVKLVGVKEQLEQCCETKKIVAAVSSNKKEALISLAQELLPTSEIVDTTCKEVGQEGTAKSSFDGILFSEPVRDYFANESGIISTGLTHLAIPRGWRWGGPASSHCPVWADFNSPF